MTIKINMTLAATIEVNDLNELTSRVDDTRKSEAKLGRAFADLKLDGGLEFDCTEAELKTCGDVYTSIQNEFTSKFNETSERLEELERRINNNNSNSCKSE